MGIDLADLMEKIIIRLTEEKTVNDAIQSLSHQDYDKLEDDIYDILEKALPWYKSCASAS